MLILDTDVLTLVQIGEGEAYTRLSERLEAVSSTRVIVVTVISLEEQMRGWLARIASAKSTERQIVAYHRLHELLDDFATRTVVDFDQGAAAEYQRLVRRKIRIGTMDLKIAAIALAHDATLLSRNLSDYRKVPNLIVEDWTV